MTNSMIFDFAFFFNGFEMKSQDIGSHLVTCSEAVFIIPPQMGGSGGEFPPPPNVGEVKRSPQIL